MKKIKTSRTSPEAVIEKEYTKCAFASGQAFPEKINGHLPAMGWNSWNAFGTENNEKLTKAMCDKFIELGLDKLGYEYIVLDDGCYRNLRLDGVVQVNEERFPSGFKALADYIHGKGLKFGMYNDIGTKLCSGLEVGTAGYEDIDGRSYADWDIDFIKVDNCYYLWDNATFSDAENARFVYAPSIKSVEVEGNGIKMGVSADKAMIVGNGAYVKDGAYVTNIGTYDGTGPGPSPVGEQSSELHFEFEVPKEGEYALKVTYATGREPEVGAWLQVMVNDGEEYALDGPVKETENKDTFITENLGSIRLKAGKNVIKLMNHRRQENTLQSYSAMFYALKEFSPKDILLSICEWGKTCPQNWGYKVGNSWRILNDITFAVGRDGDPGKANWTSDYTNSITSQYNKAVIMDEFAGLDKGWNDPDMLVVGMGGIDTTMMETHMVMWCMMNSPLMLGLDLRNVKKGDEIYNIIANKELIALNQDPLGIQAKRVKSSLCSENADTTYITNNDRYDILAKPLVTGDISVSFVNLSDHEFKDIKISLEEVEKALKQRLPKNYRLNESTTLFAQNLITGEKCALAQKEIKCDVLSAHGNYTVKVSASC